MNQQEQAALRERCSGLLRVWHGCVPQLMVISLASMQCVSY